MIMMFAYCAEADLHLPGLLTITRCHNKAAVVTKILVNLFV